MESNTSTILSLEIQLYKFTVLDIDVYILLPSKILPYVKESISKRN